MLVYCNDDGRSAVFEMGNTKVIAAVYGPREVLFLFNYLFIYFLLNLFS